jgi:mannitol 2-dehydrogenase
MCEGTREDGSIILPNDPIWEKLTVAARAAKTNPKAWLAQEDIYGDLADNAGFADLFERWLTLIWSDGLEAALTAYIQG